MLQRLQEMVLACVQHLGPDCRIGDVQSRLAGLVGKDQAFGAVFTTLDRLADRGLVTWRIGDPSPRRGGRAPRLYSVTTDGVSALAEARALAERIAGH